MCLSITQLHYGTWPPCEIPLWGGLVNDSSLPRQTYRRVRFAPTWSLHSIHSLMPVCMYVCTYLHVSAIVTRLMGTHIILRLLSPVHYWSLSRGSRAKANLSSSNYGKFFWVLSFFKEPSVQIWANTTQVDGHVPLISWSHPPTYRFAHTQSRVLCFHFLMLTNRWMTVFIVQLIRGKTRRRCGMCCN